MDLEALAKQLKQHEGVRLHPYRDTVGKLTIGVGRNLDDVGLFESEVHSLLLNDIHRTVRDLNHHLPWWRELDEIRQRVLVDMAFNLGIHGLLEFKNTLSAIQNKNYAAASSGMRSSKWAKQVGRRAERLALMMATGQDVPY